MKQSALKRVWNKENVRWWGGQLPFNVFIIMFLQKRKSHIKFKKEEENEWIHTDDLQFHQHFLKDNIKCSTTLETGPFLK